MADDGKQILSFIAMEAFSRVWRWLLSFIRKPKVKMTTFWRPSEPESFETWLPTSPYSPETNENVSIRCSIAGQIVSLGPGYYEFLASANAAKTWSTNMTQHFPHLEDLKVARGRNERLMRILAESEPWRFRSFTSFEAPQALGSPNASTSEVNEPFSFDRKVADPRLFVASGIALGISSGNAKTGDAVCQFWNSTASALLRPSPPTPCSALARFWAMIAGSTNACDNQITTYRLVGKAAMLREGQAAQWDIPTEKEIFDKTSKTAIDLSLDLRTLTRLSFDSLDL